MRSSLLLLLAACGSSHAGPDAFETFDGPPGTIGPADALGHFELDGTLTDLATPNSLVCTGAECPTFIAAGARGGAASFNGTTNCLHAPWFTSWVPDRFTLSAWVQPAGNLTGPVVVHDFATACPAPAMTISKGAVAMIVLDNALNPVGGSDGQHEQAWTDPATLAGGVWEPIVVRWDGTAQQVFVGGTCNCAITPPLPFAVNSNELDIGCYPSANTFFTGAIDEVQVFDRALSPAEIAQLATADGRAAPAPVDCSALCGSSPP
jgi:Concanavalin A-like lectin/glucanases superfamily